MHANVKIKKAHNKVYFLLYGKAFVPYYESTSVGEHDTVSVDIVENGTATVYIKHHPVETWVMLS